MTVEEDVLAQARAYVGAPCGPLRVGRDPVNLPMYADGIAAARKECPADDVATRLLQASVDGEALSQEQFDVFFLLLMPARAVDTA